MKGIKYRVRAKILWKTLFTHNCLHYIKASMLSMKITVRSIGTRLTLDSEHEILELRYVSYAHMYAVGKILFLRAVVVSSIVHRFLCTYWHQNKNKHNEYKLFWLISFQISIVKKKIILINLTIYTWVLTIYSNKSRDILMHNVGTWFWDSFSCIRFIKLFSSWKHYVIRVELFFYRGLFFF